jgi:hypothetical protein
VRRRLVHHYAERVDIRRRADDFAAELFRRSVIECSDRHASAREARILGSEVNDPQVHDLHVVIRSDKNVLGLDVSMNRAGAVHGCKPLGYFCCKITQQRLGKSAEIIDQAP